MRAQAIQRSFDDLGSTPNCPALIEQDFVVFDLETTGGSPGTCRITEIGAVRVRAGEVLGEFCSLVNPLVPIPPGITYLTGITNEMVAGAPPIESLLPAFLEFAGDAVLVAHNASFDVGFIRANCARLGYEPPVNKVVCTVRLARRLVRDEVPNLQLHTLAHAMRARTTPSHRALADARATTDVFHALLELAGRWGISHTDDLLWFQSVRAHPSYQKVRLIESLPRARGVYLFRAGDGRVLYVGKATDLRTRVRSYFGDDRKHVDDLLRELESIDHVLCATDLDASVLEARLIRTHSPPFNRAQRGRRTKWFLKLTEERFPRLSTTLSRNTELAGAGLGPLSSGVSATVREALEEAADVRTCTMKITARTQRPPCVRGQIGRCSSPCTGAADHDAYMHDIEPVARALAGDPSAVLDRLSARIDRLSAEERYEQAVTTRDGLGALVDAVRTSRAVDALVRAGCVIVEVGSVIIVLEHGCVASVNGRALAVPSDEHPDEPRLIVSWLWRNRARARLQSCDGVLAMQVGGGRLLARWHERFRRLTKLDTAR